MKAVPFGPVTVLSQDDVDAMMLLVKIPPKVARGAKAPKLGHVALTIVPREVKPSKKPKVAFQYLWGDWSGISFWF